MAGNKSVRRKYAPGLSCVNPATRASASRSALCLSSGVAALSHMQLAMVDISSYSTDGQPDRLMNHGAPPTMKNPSLCPTSPAKTVITSQPSRFFAKIHREATENVSRE